MLKIEYTFQSYGGNHVSGVVCTDGRDISQSLLVFGQPVLDENFQPNENQDRTEL